MPFISVHHVDLALQRLEALTKPMDVGILSMLRQGVPTLVGNPELTGEAYSAAIWAEARQRAIPFGAGDDNRLLSTYFMPIGGPVERPFYMPCGVQTASGDGRWRDRNYAGRSLHRLRTLDRRFANAARRTCTGVVCAATFIDHFPRRDGDGLRRSRAPDAHVSRSHRYVAGALSQGADCGDGARPGVAPTGRAFG